MIPTTASKPMKGAQAAAASGSMGIAILINPYVPNLRRTAARITEPTVGA